MQDEQYKNYRIFHYCSSRPDKLANAAFLMGAFMVIVLKVSPMEAFEAFKQYHN
jgi:cell division cycle 14